MAFAEGFQASLVIADSKLCQLHRTLSVKGIIIFSDLEREGLGYGNRIGAEHGELDVNLALGL